MSTESTGGTNPQATATPSGVAGATARTARPRFADAVHPPSPDFADPANWAAMPGRPSAADVTPQGVIAPEDQASALADVFYIHPTTDLAADHWNPHPADAAVNAWTDLSVVARQASVFNACCRVYAPRYRQAVLDAVEDPVNGMPAYDLAYQDVRRAFLYYLEHFHRGRPLVLAGHSQGALHLYRLLEELVDGTALRHRLVVAYAVGVGIARREFGRRYRNVTACAGPDDTGCVVSWNTFTAGADIGGYLKTSQPGYLSGLHATDPRELLCTNPLTFDDARPFAPASANLGALVGPPTAGRPELVPGIADAHCSNGVVFVGRDAVAKLGLESWPDGNLHMDDIGLFYANLRENVATRVRAFVARDGDRTPPSARA